MSDIPSLFPFPVTLEVMSVACLPPAEFDWWSYVHQDPDDPHSLWFENHRDSFQKILVSVSPVRIYDMVTELSLHFHFQVSFHRISLFLFRFFRPAQFLLLHQINPNWFCFVVFWTEFLINRTKTSDWAFFYVYRIIYSPFITFFFLITVFLGYALELSRLNCICM